MVIRSQDLPHTYMHVPRRFIESLCFWIALITFHCRLMMLERTVFQSNIAHVLIQSDTIRRYQVVWADTGDHLKSLLRVVGFFNRSIRMEYGLDKYLL